MRKVSVESRLSSTAHWCCQAPLSRGRTHSQPTTDSAVASVMEDIGGAARTNSLVNQQSQKLAHTALHRSFLTSLPLHPLAFANLWGLALHAHAAGLTVW